MLFAQNGESKGHDQLDDPKLDSIKHAKERLSFVDFLSPVQTGELSFEVLHTVHKIACFKTTARLFLTPSSTDLLDKVTLHKTWTPCPQGWFGDL